MTQRKPDGPMHWSRVPQAIDRTTATRQRPSGPRLVMPHDGGQLDSEEIRFEINLEAIPSHNRPHCANQPNR